MAGEGDQCARADVRARVCVRVCVCVGGRRCERFNKKKGLAARRSCINKPCDLTRTPQLLIHVDNVGADTVIRVDGVASSELNLLTPRAVSDSLHDPIALSHARSRARPLTLSLSRCAPHLHILQLPVWANTEGACLNRLLRVNLRDITCDFLHDCFAYRTFQWHLCRPSFFFLLAINRWHVGQGQGVECV